MATWHITVHSTVGEGRTFQLAIQSLKIRAVQAQFESLGFTTQSMPEHGVPALSVSHSSESAITLFRLRYDSEHIDIKRVV